MLLNLETRTPAELYKGVILAMLEAHRNFATYSKNPSLHKDERKSFYVCLAHAQECLEYLIPETKINIKKYLSSNSDQGPVMDYIDSITSTTIDGTIVYSVDIDCLFY